MRVCVRKGWRFEEFFDIKETVVKLARRQFQVFSGRYVTRTYY